MLVLGDDPSWTTLGQSLVGSSQCWLGSGFYVSGGRSPRRASGS